MRKELADAKADKAEAEAKLDIANAEITDLRAQIVDRDATIGEKDAWIGELKDTVLYMDRRLEAADAKADEQTAKVDALTGTVAEQRDQIKTMSGKLDELGTMLGDALKQMNSPEQARPDAPAGDDPTGVNRAEGRLLGRDAQGDRKKLATTLRQEFRAAVVDTTVAGSAVVPAVMAVDSKTPAYIAGIAVTVFGASVAATRTVRRWIGAHSADRPEG